MVTQPAHEEVRMNTSVGHATRAIASLSAVLLLAACATTTPAAKPPVAATVKDQNCLNRTASRIPAVTGPCQSYSADDISKTGASTAGGALRLLSPSLSVNH
jgi:uncharacterized lipoprotein YajG